MHNILYIVSYIILIIAHTINACTNINDYDRNKDKISLFLFWGSVFVVIMCAAAIVVLALNM